MLNRRPLEAGYVFLTRDFASSDDGFKRMPQQKLLSRSRCRPNELSPVGRHLAGAGVWRGEDLRPPLNPEDWVLHEEKQKAAPRAALKETIRAQNYQAPVLL